MEAGADRQGEQALVHVLGDLAHRDGHSIRYGEPWPGARLWRVLLVLLIHGGPLSWCVFGGHPTPTPRAVSGGGPPLKIHETRDNLPQVVAVEFFSST